ncbi:MAG: hypothetical protein JNM01_22225 [Delftia acidovorans]|nr:hypothetical protein [Delftia acidovorans]
MATNSNDRIASVRVLSFIIYLTYTAAAQASASFPPISLLDARKPQAAIAVSGGSIAATGQQHYFRLAPETSQTPECCVTTGQPAESSILRYQGKTGTEAVAADARAALFMPPVAEGFIGLQLAEGARVRVLGPQRLLVWWPDRPGLTRVDHCLSREGLHVQWREQVASGRWAGAQHYYLPLGMDVEPDCSPPAR